MTDLLLFFFFYARTHTYRVECQASYPGTNPGLPLLPLTVLLMEHPGTVSSIIATVPTDLSAETDTHTHIHRDARMLPREADKYTNSHVQNRD